VFDKIIKISVRCDEFNCVVALSALSHEAETAPPSILLNFAAKK
jgi:hypothetical protein